MCSETSRPTRRVALLSLLILASTIVTSGSTAKKQESRLRRMEHELKTLRDEIRYFEGEEESVLRTLQRSAAEIRLLSTEASWLEGKIEAEAVALTDLEKRSDTLRAQLAQQGEFLSNSLAQLYKLGQFGYLRLLLSVDDQRDILSSVRYLSLLSKQNADRIAAFRRNAEALDRTQQELEQERLSLLVLQRESDQKAEELISARKRQQGYFSQVHAERALREQAAQELDEATTALETFLAQLDENDPALAPPLPRMTKFQGLLEWPVDGMVTQPFGKIQHPQFGTAILHQGIDIQAKLGETVRAVFDGTVAFGDWFGAYGKTILLSHGNSYYSVYTHLENLLVSVGDFIAQGEEIATVGATGSLSGPYLYFEIRHASKAEDPLLWLKRKEEFGPLRSLNAN